MSGLEGLLAGKVLVNRYRIGEVIGRGGFAAVYRADDERLGRTVAVKVITLAAPDPAAQAMLRERFQREARSAAALPQHPNVVTVYDFGTDPETGIDFLVMELLRGEDLASRLAREPRLPLDLATCIVREAAEGLAVGHRAGLVHRDVKPGNVFLGETQGDGPFRVCVVDFGIARVAAEEATAARLTQAGSAPLSPAYASPEQLRGDADLTPASDVFSLGVVAYQLFTGERPFPAERRRGPGGWDVGSVADKAPALPPAVAAVVQRALAFDAADRFADAGAFAAALDEATGKHAAPAPAAPPLVMAPEPDEAIHLPPSPSPAAATAAGAAFGASMGDDDDRTLLNAGAPPPVARPPYEPPADPPFVAPRGETGARTAPVAGRKSRAMPIALFAALVLAGGGAMAAYVSHGKGGKDARTATSDTAASAPTTAPSSPSASEGGTADGAAAPISSPASAGAMDTGGSVPANVPPLDPGASQAPAPSASPPPAPAPQPATQRPAPLPAGTTTPAPAQPAPSRPSAPAPARPSAPAPARPASPAPPETASAQPAQPAPEPKPASKPTPPPDAPRDTVHIGTPPPSSSPAPRDTLKLGPTSPPPPTTSPPPAPSSSTPPPARR